MTTSYKLEATNGNGEPKANALPCITIDTHRMKDNSSIAPDDVSNIQKRIQAVVKILDTTKDVQVTAIQIRGHNVDHSETSGHEAVDRLAAVSTREDSVIGTPSWANGTSGSVVMGGGAQDETVRGCRA
jgi:hypothetical protein